MRRSSPERAAKGTDIRAFGHSGIRAWSSKQGAQIKSTPLPAGLSVPSPCKHTKVWPTRRLGLQVGLGKFVLAACRCDLFFKFQAVLGVRVP